MIDIIDLSQFFQEGPDQKIIAIFESFKKGIPDDSQTSLKEEKKKEYKPPFDQRVDGKTNSPFPINQILLHCVRTSGLFPEHPTYGELKEIDSSDAFDEKTVPSSKGIGDVMGTLGGFTALGVSTHYFVTDSSGKEVQATAKFSLKTLEKLSKELEEKAEQRSNFIKELLENKGLDKGERERQLKEFDESKKSQGTIYSNYMKAIIPWRKALDHIASVTLTNPDKPVAVMMVDPKHMAWHAGVSCWRIPAADKPGDYIKADRINPYSIGIEVACPGYAKGEKGDNWYKFSGFTQKQGEVVEHLLRKILEEHPTIPPHMIQYHSDTGWFRNPPKTDPGPSFGFIVEKLADKGIGFMPSLKGEIPHLQTQGIKFQWIVTRLQEVGYNVPDTFTPPVNSAPETLFFKALDAFRMHFLPEEALSNLLKGGEPIIVSEENKTGGEIISGWAGQSMRVSVLIENGEKMVTDTLLKALANRFPWESSKKVDGNKESGVSDQTSEALEPKCSFFQKEEETSGKNTGGGNS